MSKWRCTENRVYSMGLLAECNTVETAQLIVSEHTSHAALVEALSTVEAFLKDTIARKSTSFTGARIKSDAKDSLALLQSALALAKGQP